VGPPPSEPPKILTAGRRPKPVDYGAALRDAARRSGRSEARIVLELLGRRLGRQRITSDDFFKLGLYRPGLTAAEKAAYVTSEEITRLNRALGAQGSGALDGLVGSKILTELLLRGAGLPTSRTVALARAGNPEAALPFPVLTDAAGIAAFLSAPGVLPVFGKPDDARQGIGAASLLAVEGDTVRLGDGTRAGLSAFAAEIARDYPRGYLFQALLRPHPALQALIGPVIGSLRVVTLRQACGPEVLVVMLKMPGPGAMVDGGLGGANAAAVVDPATGRILRAQQLGAPADQPLTRNQVTGADLTDAVLPDVPQAVALSLQVHRLFPGQGVLGHDIMLTPDGPLVNEINLNPGSILVQAALGRGLFDEGTRARYREALALMGVKLPVKGVRL
jgi:hypothetical protein